MIKDQLSTSRTDYERFERRRRYPRIVLDNRASLLFPGDQTVNVLIYDLSICAIQTRFDTQTEQTIKSVLQYLDDSELSTIKVRFKLKLHDREEDVYAPCKPMYIYQLDRDIYAMGLQFADLEIGYQSLIKNFIEVCLEPA